MTNEDPQKVDQVPTSSQQPPLSPTDQMITNGHPVYEFVQLSKETGMIFLRFEGVLYTLKQTRNRRLVLHK
ncbi:MAG: hypothetical protein AAF989_07405 [Planctomycetota bacterium]